MRVSQKIVQYWRRTGRVPEEAPLIFWAEVYWREQKCSSIDFLNALRETIGIDPIPKNGRDVECS